MDLKRAWRNGFLASMIFAIPLSDLYNNQYSNLIADSGAKKTHVQQTANGLVDGNSDDVTGSATSWDNSVDEGSLTIPGNTVTDLLLGSDDADFSDPQKTAVRFDTEDLFQSEQLGVIDLNNDDDFGPLASLSYGFGNPSGFAPGFSGPFTPGMLAPGGKTASAETSFVDPLAADSTPTETGDADSLANSTSPGTGNESLHNVPEPSSFLLITIGTISVASLLYRKSKSPIPHS